jgi:YHS domain-containing protein
MRRRLLIGTTAAAVTLALSAAVSAAQQPQHQAAAADAQMAVAECARVQPQVMGVIDGANMRLEAARQNNSPAAMRAAMDDLEGALGRVRAQLAVCAALQAAPAADSGHVMPATQPAAAAPGTPVTQPGSTTPAPAAPRSAAPVAGDPHAGHTMPKPPASATPQGTTGMKPKPGTAKSGPARGAADAHAGHAMPKSQQAPAAPTGKEAAKPAPTKPEPSASARDPHAGHGTPASPATDARQPKVMDPVTGLMVDPATAPKASYQGQTYYFSSEQAREEFLQNPAKFTKKPKQ